MDQQIDISDLLCITNIISLGVQEPPCEAQFSSPGNLAILDWNGDGGVDISDAIYGARHVGLKAGVGQEAPALTVNRLCGSGIQSVISGVHQILLDEASTCLVGGMENMSQAPFVLDGARQGFRFGVFA